MILPNHNPPICCTEATEVARGTCLVRMGVSKDLTQLSSALVEEMLGEDATEKGTAFMHDMVQMICGASVFPM